MARVGLQELLVGQRGDGARVSAGLKAVCGVGEELPGERLVKHVVGVGERTLHLVEDHPVVGEACVCALSLDLQVPALLLEDARAPVDGGVQDRVQVDAHEVLEVRRVGGGHRVHGLVREGQRVQKGLHGRLEQVDEGLLHRVSVRAAQHRVLQDVEDARVVCRRGLEADGKGLVDVRAGKPQRPGAGGVVAQDVGLARDLGHGLDVGDGEACVACPHRKRGVGCVKGCLVHVCAPRFAV